MCETVKVRVRFIENDTQNHDQNLWQCYVMFVIFVDVSLTHPAVKGFRNYFRIDRKEKKCHTAIKMKVRRLTQLDCDIESN